MCYNVTVFENPSYEAIMTLSLNIMYFLASYCQVTRCDTNGSCLQKALVNAITVSGTAWYITVLLI